MVGTSLIVMCSPDACFTVPHLLRDLNPESKARSKSIYRRLKRGLSVGSLIGIVIWEGKDFIMDIAKSKVKKHGYKLLLGVTCYPMLQGISIPIYVLSNHKKIRSVATTIAETGSSILKGQLALTNLPFLCLDLILFGEPVSITDNSNFSIWHNETAPTIDEIISTSRS
jgi:hypothetical protein